MAKEILFNADVTSQANNFLKGFRDNPLELSKRQRMFGEISFSETFDALFGGEKTEGLYDEPYSKRFEYIYINGQSVNSMFERQTARMKPEDAEMFMKNAVTAALNRRDSIVEVCTPVKDERGLFTGRLSEPIHVRPHAAEKPPRTGIMGIFERIGRGISSVLEAVGLAESRDKNKIYDELYNCNNSPQQQSERRSMIKKQADASGKQTIDVHTDVKERAEIQTKLYENSKNALNKEANVKDMKWFFGNTTSDDFSAKKMHGIATLKGEPGTPRIGRLSMVRLYMLSQGCTVDQIFSQEGKDRHLKRAIGKEYMDIMQSNDPERIGKMYADIGKTLNELPVPDINLKDDRALAGFYKQFALMGCVVDFEQSIGLKTPVEEMKDPKRKECLQVYLGHMNLKDGELEKSEKVRGGINSLRRGLEDKYEFMLGSDYSAANDGKRKEIIGGNLLDSSKANSSDETWRLRTYSGHKLLEEIAPALQKTKGQTFDKANIDFDVTIGNKSIHMSEFSIMGLQQQQKAYDSFLKLAPPTVEKVNDVSNDSPEKKNAPPVREGMGGYSGLVEENKIPKIGNNPPSELKTDEKSMSMGGKGGNV